MFTEFQDAVRALLAQQLPKIKGEYLGEDRVWLFYGQADEAGKVQMQMAHLSVQDGKVHPKDIADVIVKQRALSWAMVFDMPYHLPFRTDLVAVICDPGQKLQVLDYHAITNNGRVYVTSPVMALRGTGVWDAALKRLDAIHLWLPATEADRLTCRKEVADVKG
jgi:hypothetical protein